IDEAYDGSLKITNLSPNGLSVNGVAVQSSVKLPDRATIQLGHDGPTVRFELTASGVFPPVDPGVPSPGGKWGLPRKGPDTEARPVVNEADLEDLPAPAAAKAPVQATAPGGGSGVVLFVVVGVVLVAILGVVAFLALH